MSIQVWRSVMTEAWDLRSLFSFPIFMMMSAIFLFLFLVPVIRLLLRTGHSAFWCLLALFPGVNVIAFWVFAFKPWATDAKTLIAKH